MAISPLFESTENCVRNPERTCAQADLLCFSHLRWHFVTQRPQHLMARAAMDRRVFFVEEPVWDGEGDSVHLEILQEQPSLWIIKPHLPSNDDSWAVQRTLLAQLLDRFSIRRYVCWYYTPIALRFADRLAPLATVYDCMDELTGFLGAPPQLEQLEQKLFATADVVFTGGMSLYESKRRQHRNVHAFPSAVDAKHFAQALTGTLAEPMDQATIPHPRAGFFGVIDERFDAQLLGEVARLRPDTHFVVLGPTVKIDPAGLPCAANIHYLGGKTYEQLPAYLAGWDVALLPFAHNAATRFISPTKTPEYLAAGKPVVSTSIHDVVRGYGEPGLVAIADSPADFAAAIGRALMPQPESWRKAVQAKLAECSWDATWAAMQQELQLAETKRNRVAAEHSSGLKEKISSHTDFDSLHIANPLPAIGGRKLAEGREKFDYLVVGAGFAGSILAERLASQLGKRVLLIDKRDHIGGNAYDCHNADGILIHRYGPHIFHTNSDKVVAYLSQFTKWRQYEHRVLASVDGKLLPVPINLDTINGLYGLQLDEAGMRGFLAERAISAPVIRTSEEIVVSRVGRELYEKFFRGYTRKQWGLDPSELDASVAGRIPVRFDRDDRYFTDSFQAMPLDGFTRMFERMVDHPGITVRTGTDYQEIARSYPQAKVIYTGPIDEYYGFQFGRLPYRSLRFRHETHDCAQFQPAPVVNYPNDHAYTRVTEFKYLTGQRHTMTSLVYEYPSAEGDPYYPIPRPENALLYSRYKALADRDTHVRFCGRLANYRYLNMDQVAAQALLLFREIAKEETVVVPLPMQPETVLADALEVA